MKRLLILLLFIITFCLYSKPKYFSYEAMNIIKDYEEGLVKAKMENKPIFLHFTAHALGSRKIEEEEIFGDWKTYTKLRDEFINVWLYVDERRKVEEYISPLSGKTIRDIGNKNADLQYVKFGEQTQPLFVILNYKGEQLSKEPIGYLEAKNGGLLPFLESID